MDKNDFLHAYVESTPVDYKETSINDSQVLKEVEGEEYVDRLNNDAMLTDDVFDRLNERMNWAHIKQVMDRTHEKYDTPQPTKKTSKERKILELIKEIIEYADE